MKGSKYNEEMHLTMMKETALTARISSGLTSTSQKILDEDDLETLISEAPEK